MRYNERWRKLVCFVTGPLILGADSLTDMLHLRLANRRISQSDARGAAGQECENLRADPNQYVACVKTKQQFFLRKSLISASASLIL